VAILSNSYFERRFHRDPKALGKTVTLDGTAYTVIGVLSSAVYMPRTRFDDSQPDVVVPLASHLLFFIACGLRVSTR
jgi:hypothetical protein